MFFRPSRFAVILGLLVVGLLATAPAAAAGRPSLRDWQQLADRLVEQEIAPAGVTDKRVLRAIRTTPRHEFMPVPQRPRAYLDMALPIGAQQTISPPFVVAYMTEQIDPQPSDRVLEVGTGSGYQAAVLSPLVRDVYTIEIVESLGRRAARTLERLDYDNVHPRIGDGFQGWPEAAPFDKIIVTCSPEEVPQPLVDQLRDGGLMIVPVGERYQQNLFLFRKEEGELTSAALRPTLFVPMTGKAEQRRAVQPDPARPELVNGSFEQLATQSGEQQPAGKPARGARDDDLAAPTPAPTGWHYQRQLSVETDPSAAPDGQRFVTFRNDEPGRGAQALQGFAVDGREVAKLTLAGSVRGQAIRRGAAADQWPMIVVTFMDDRRAMIGNARVGPFYGSFDWTTFDESVDVPLAARAAILRIGLLGAVGELSIDAVRISAAD